jgi:hypothetical protein
MAISAVFQADFTAFNRAVKDATSALKPLELQGKGVQQQLAAIQKSFSGATLIKQANLAVAAIGDIKNVTKLTEAEQKKLNATVTEAIAKYAALGQKAPADMVALAKATKQSESALGGIGAALGPLAGLFAGAFTVGAITSAAGEAIKFAGSLNDLSAKTGISVEALQEFKFAGSAVGVTLDDVTAAVLQMQKHLVGGDASVSGALKTIGVSFEQLKQLRPEDQFTLIAEKLKGIEDPALRNKLAFDLMGKTAANVLPLIAGGLEEARKKAEELGLVLDQDTVNQLDNLGDTWDALKVAGQALIAKVLVPFAPLLTDIASVALNLAGPIGDLSKLHLGFAHAIIQAQLQLNALDIKFAESANVGGIFDKKISELIDNGVSLIAASRTIASEIQGVGTAAGKAAPVLAHFGEKVKESGDDADKTRDQLNAVRDDILKVSGAIDKMFTKDAEDAAKRETEALKQFTDAVNEMSGQSGLEKATFDLDAFDAAMKQGGVTASAAKKVYGELEEAIANVESGAAKLPGTTEENARALAHMKDVAGTLGGELSRLEGHLDNIIKRNVQLAAMNPFGPMLKDADKAVKKVGEVEKAFEKIADAIPNILVNALIHHASVSDTAAALGTEIGSDIGEAVGASVGGPIGAAIGKSLGSLLGPLLKHLFKDRAAEEVGSVAYDFGVTISKDFAQGIEDQAKAQFGGNRQATKIFDLDQIISQGGGLTEKNLGVLEDRLHDVFSLLQTGALSGDQAMSVLDKNFQTFVDYLGGNVDPALKNIIKLNDEFGLHSKAIAQYVDAEANSALGSLKRVVDARQAALDALNNAKTPEERKKATAQLDALPLTKNSGAAFGGALFGIFERLTKDGASVIDTLKQIDPVIESLDKQFAAAGISGGAAFDKIKSLAGIATDEIAGPSFEAIQSYTDALEALNNAGILDQEQFSGLTDQITATYQAAVDALVSEGKDGSAALQLVAPDLQKIWELQQDFGYAVDEGTQALLNQAEAAGEVGEKHRSVQAQTLDVMKHLDDVLTGIGQKFGVYIPSQIDKTGAAFDKLGNKIGDAVDQIPDHIDIPIDFPVGTYQQGPPDQYGGVPVHPMADGGIGSVTRPTLFLAGERGPEDFAFSGGGRSFKSSSATTASAPTVVIMQIDKREIGRAIADALPGELRRLGVRVRT